MSKTTSSGSSSDSPLYSSAQSVSSSRTSLTTLCNTNTSTTNSKSVKLQAQGVAKLPRDAIPLQKYKTEEFSAWKSYIGDDEPDFEHIAWKKEMTGEIDNTAGTKEESKGWKHFSGILKARDKDRKAKEARLAESQRSMR